MHSLLGLLLFDAAFASQGFVSSEKGFMVWKGLKPITLQDLERHPVTEGTYQPWF